MIMHLRPRAAGASQEWLTGKFRPPYNFRCCKRMILLECHEEGLCPQ